MSGAMVCLMFRGMSSMGRELARGVRGVKVRLNVQVKTVGERERERKRQRDKKKKKRLPNKSSDTATQRFNSVSARVIAPVFATQWNLGDKS